MNYAEITKEIRMLAKKAGFTFKRSNMNINGSPAYHFADRKSGRVVLSNCTLNTAYENCLSGYIETLQE